MSYKSSASVFRLGIPFTCIPSICCAESISVTRARKPTRARVTTQLGRSVSGQRQGGEGGKGGWWRRTEGRGGRGVVKAGRGKGVWKDNFWIEKDFCMSVACVAEGFLVVQRRFMRPSGSLFIHIPSFTSLLIRAVLSPKTPRKVSIMQASSSLYP